MNNDDTMLGMNRTTRLKAEVTYLMLKGAGYAAVFVVAIWVVLAVIAALGRQLPDDSRNASDPTPLSAQVEAEPMLVQIA